MATTIVWFRAPQTDDWCEVYTLEARAGIKPSRLRLAYGCLVTRNDAHRMLARMAPYHMATRLPLSAAGRSVLLSTMFAPDAPACGAQVGYKSVPTGMLLNNPNLSAGARWALTEEAAPNISGDNNG